jgi:hypothetical protein
VVRVVALGRQSRRDFQPFTQEPPSATRVVLPTAALAVSGMSPLYRSVSEYVQNAAGET